MARANGRIGLGVFLRDRARSIVVVTQDGELAVALRDCVDGSRALIRDVRPAELGQAAEACRPWPWMVVCDGGAEPGGLAELLTRRPVLLAWLGTPPGTLAPRAVSTQRFGTLAAAVNGALEAMVGGMRLAPWSGVQLPSGRVVRAADLEALIAAHPAALPLPLRAFRTASRTLGAHGVAWRPQRTAAGVVLAPRGAAA